ncbi:MAG: hypothetical protein HY918_00760 [Candidatus Doudnabacteria bacterium]|nr:hypothetical protein [Candidatus Doudnabacteria bacterium]
MPIENASVPVKLGKFQASKMIVKESWAVLKQDKEIMWFPVLSTITTIFAVLIMGIAFFVFILHGNVQTWDVPKDGKISDVVMYSTLFVYYLVVFFIVNFFETGLFIIVQGRFSGQDLGFHDGMNGAANNFNKIFIWSFISATVGIVLRIIADKSKLIGRIVASLFGAAWNILTYFSLPSLVIGNTGIKDSFKESAAMIRKTWGETIIVNFGVGLFFALLIFLLTALFVGMVIIFHSLAAFFIGLGLFIAIMIVLSIVSTTLDSIFKLALYNYARTGQVPVGFTKELIEGAIQPGKV